MVYLHVCIFNNRELAVQISQTIQCSFSRFNIKMPGYNWWRRNQAQTRTILRRPHIIVATPGRLMDHFLNSPQVIGCFQNLRFLVLDEADRLLEPSFESELRILFENIPSKRQTLLFSASITRNIAALQHITMNDLFIF